jgi:hypothetical protein
LLLDLPGAQDTSVTRPVFLPLGCGWWEDFAAGDRKPETREQMTVKLKRPNGHPSLNEVISALERLLRVFNLERMLYLAFGLVSLVIFAIAGFRSSRL